MSVRILYISANGFPGSSSDSRGVFSLEHANALIKQGATVDAIDASRTQFRDDEIQGIKVKRVPRVRVMLRALDLFGLVKYARFYLECRRADYDAIIFSFFYLKYLPLILLLRSRRRVILLIAHGGEVMPGGAVRSYLKRLMFSLVDAVTPVSDFTETLFSCLVRRRQRHNHKILTIYNGVDPEKLTRSSSPNDIRLQLGVAGEDFLVLSVANLIKRKGIDIVVQAISALLEEGRSIHHVIIGRGPERESLVRLASLHGEGERFSFIDAVEGPDLANYYAAADLFALISITDWDACQVEGFGITYAEAMAMGKPVIGGGGSGTSTPIKHGFNGILVDPYDPDVIEDVSATIRLFMDDSKYYERVAANASSYVNEVFSWDRNAARTLSLIGRLRAAKKG